MIRLKKLNRDENINNLSDNIFNPIFEQSSSYQQTPTDKPSPQESLLIHGKKYKVVDRQETHLSWASGTRWLAAVISVASFGIVPALSDSIRNIFLHGTQIKRFVEEESKIPLHTKTTETFKATLPSISEEEKADFKEELDNILNGAEAYVKNPEIARDAVLNAFNTSNRSLDTFKTSLDNNPQVTENVDDLTLAAIKMQFQNILNVRF